MGGTVKTSSGTYQPLPEIAKGKASNNFMDVFNASVQVGGQTLHGDHATVFYQIPSNPRPYPLVFLHGAGQSMRTWQTTPDGREGFQNIFLRKNYPVYLVDQPRRGWSGRSTVDAETKPHRMINSGLPNSVSALPEFQSRRCVPKRRTVA